MVEGPGHGRRTTWAAAALVVAAALVAGGVATAHRGSPPAVAPGSAAGWQPLPVSPLSPRDQAITGWTGSEVLVIGGEPHVDPCIAVLCTGGAPPRPGDAGPRLTSLRDGAAFDPVTGSWRAISEAPARLSTADPFAVVGHDLVVEATGARWLDYDAASDSWLRLPRPPGAPTLDEVDAAGGMVCAFDESDWSTVDVLDLAHRRWTPLPPRRHVDDLESSGLVATPIGPVLVGDLLPAHRGHGRRGPLAVDLLRLAGPPVFVGHRWVRIAPRGGRHATGPWVSFGTRLAVATVRNGRRAWTEVDLLNRHQVHDLPAAPVVAAAPGEALPAASDGTVVSERRWGVHASSPTLVVDGRAVWDDVAQTWSTLPLPPAPVDRLAYGGSTVWAGRTLVTFGGVTGWPTSGTPLATSAQGWMLTLPPSEIANGAR